MPQYTGPQLAAFATAYDDAGADVPQLIESYLGIIKAMQAPSPIPQKAHRDGATEQQKKCGNIAYLLYEIELTNPNVDAQQAKDDYCANFEACYPA